MSCAVWQVDVYSYAMVLWFMIHGDRPLVGTLEKDFIAAADNHISLRPSLGDVTYGPFKALIQKCWEANPVQRITAAEAALEGSRVLCRCLWMYGRN